MACDYEEGRIVQLSGHREQGIVMTSTADDLTQTRLTRATTAP